ncbi:hypothetical protein L6164_031057 [Bauhinia variegata]|uniref:Uncharacterized protein n=1 Tax=Bauhinia variegata TaxID=167791 RepID=A0ACB9LFL7_BAUVA|nr:hypothetical protein L6164_031057 [Bauhinia variegata]
MAHSGKAFLVQWLVAALFVALLGGAKAYLFCGLSSTKLNLCRPAITGESPPLPTEECCAVVYFADLACLCRYKFILLAFGINPIHALALPTKCGLKTPPECRGNCLIPIF